LCGLSNVCNLRDGKTCFDFLCGGRNWFGIVDFIGDSEGKNVKMETVGME
jgi:hypothetical protein